MQLFLMLLDSVQPLHDQVVGSLRRTPGPEYDVNIATRCWLYRLTHLSNDNTFASMCIRHIAPISENNVLFSEILFTSPNQSRFHGKRTKKCEQSEQLGHWPLG